MKIGVFYVWASGLSAGMMLLWPNHLPYSLLIFQTTALAILGVRRIMRPESQGADGVAHLTGPSGKPIYRLVNHAGGEPTIERV